MKAYLYLLCFFVAACVYAPTLTADDDNTADPPHPVLGGGCTYEDIPGIVTITSITDPTPDTNVCPKPSQVVLFSFTPTGADAPLFTDRAITIGDGKALPTACLAPLALTVGAVIPNIVLKKITSGSCSPIVFSWPEGFLQPCTDACN